MTGSWAGCGKGLGIPVLALSGTVFKSAQLSGRYPLPKSPWGQAVHYALNQWDDLTLYAQLGCLAIDNNVAERALRGIALGRKNWLFVGSPTGGHTAARLFTLLASCQRHHVEPWAYLRAVLQRLATPCTAEELRTLFPYHWQPQPTTS